MQSSSSSSDKKDTPRRDGASIVSERRAKRAAKMASPPATKPGVQAVTTSDEYNVAAKKVDISNVASKTIDDVDPSSTNVGVTAVSNRSDDKVARKIQSKVSDGYDGTNKKQEEGMEHVKDHTNKIVPGAVAATKERRSKATKAVSTTNASNVTDMDVVVVKQRNASDSKAVVPGAVHAVKERRSKNPTSSTATKAPLQLDDVVAAKQSSGNKTNKAASTPGAVHATKEPRSKNPKKVSTTDATNDDMIAAKQRSDDSPAVVPGALTAIKERRSKEDGVKSNVDNVSNNEDNNEVSKKIFNTSSIAESKKSAIGNSMIEEAEEEPNEEIIQIDHEHGQNPYSAAVSQTVAPIINNQKVFTSSEVNTTDILEIPKGYDSCDKGGNKGGFIPDEDLVVAVAIDDEELDNGVVAEQIDLNQKKSKQRKYMKIAGVAIVVIVGVVLAVALLVTKEETKEDSSTEAPTPAPTTSRLPLNKRYLEGILVNTSGSDVLDDVNSPQYQALAWISEEDPEKLSTVDNRFLQRYAMSVLYFATNGDAWISCYRNDSSCESKQRYLSENECDWFGSYCDNEMIVSISIVSNNLNGYIPEEISLLTSLVQLRLNENSIQGNIPKSIGSLTSLATLTLTKNRMTGTIPDGLYNLSNLINLQIGMNLFTGSISSNIGTFHHLAGLYLFENSFGGTIPTEIGLTKLNFLSLYENSFRGSIPSELGGLSSTLIDLNLHTNRLTGEIPTELGLLIALGLETDQTAPGLGLQLQSNSLSGTIPTEIFSLNLLQLLNLSFNLFEGPLDSNIGELSKLRILNLSGNEFTGQLPENLGNLLELDTLLLHQNDFTGSFPASICETNPPGLLGFCTDCDVAETGCQCCSMCAGSSGVCTNI